MKIGEYFIMISVWSANVKKTPLLFRSGAIGLRLELVSKVVFRGIFRTITSHNIGTTGGPHQIPRFLYCILDNNPWVR